MTSERPGRPDTPDRDDENVPAGTTGYPGSHGPATGPGSETGTGEAADRTRSPAGKSSGKGDGKAAGKGDGKEAGQDARGGGLRRSPVVIASVAAAVLLAGGGGAYLAATAHDGSGPAVAGPGRTPPPPLALDGYPGPPAASGGAHGIAPGEPAPYGVRYEAVGDLPGGPGSAPVYRPAGEVGADEVARLAQALGVAGTPVAAGTGWRVGTGKDFFGPGLGVAAKAPGNWTFQRYPRGSDDCKGAATCSSDPAGPADPVSGPAAGQAAAPVLKALGQDTAKLDTSRVVGALRVVRADPVVAGLPTYGWTTELTVNNQGEVVAGSGLLTVPENSRRGEKLEQGDTYPVLGARRTLDLMNAAPRGDHRMGIGGCPGPVPLRDRLEQPCEAGASAVASRPGTATVRTAVFGLAAHSAAGRPTLVPSWLFEVRGPGAQDAYTVAYPAVDPAYLGGPSPSATRPRPPVAPGAPGKTESRDTAVAGYTAADSELTVNFSGSVCSAYTASADENADRVKLR
ncbi:hypothetical protein [Streptomyces sp. NPDC006012]|uniref:hypothetical protein n=1 Tax=Streptomyces sp. NPDC006012 TaxID=3364739 RepID=UPI003694D026